MYRPGLLQFQPDRQRLRLDSDLHGHNHLIGNGLQLQSPRRRLQRNFQPLFQCSGAQPDNTARRFQLYCHSNQNADLERLSGKRRLDQPVLHREMYRAWLLQLFPDCDYFEHVLHRYFRSGGDDVQLPCKSARRQQFLRSVLGSGDGQHSGLLRQRGGRRKQRWKHDIAYLLVHGWNEFQPAAACQLNWRHVSRRYLVRDIRRGANDSCYEGPRRRAIDGTISITCWRRPLEPTTLL